MSAVDDVMVVVKDKFDVTNLSEIYELSRQIADYRRWLDEERQEPARLELCYQMTVDWPLGTRVRIKGTNYKTLDGLEGVIDHLVYPTRGNRHVQIAIWTGKARKSPRYYVDDKGNVLLHVRHVEVIE